VKVGFHSGGEPFVAGWAFERAVRDRRLQDRFAAFGTGDVHWLTLMSFNFPMEIAGYLTPSIFCS
jgi:hypothetical protein